MKKITLLALLLLTNTAFAQKCAVPHAWIPSKHTSLLNKNGTLDDYSIFRTKLIKSGWQPIISDMGTNPDLPEENCIADRCIYKYKDKNNNQLYVEKPDDISLVQFTCSKK
ncbi:hypothetical protein [Acinetobacter sp. HY1485]|uniref:hypothetical protein n=1 Tax=Acinetobacter sp. HY1485 TaxID=2970918 RepID=UPI0022B9CCBA|nr:hypothetical protein [Acinetobacter sp. HY1485]